MKKFIVATNNNGKIKEIKEILKDFSLEVLTMSEVGVTKEIEENGSTFKENAMIKAREVCSLTNEIVMADDSGLMVDYLDGAPGIYTARFAGENATYEEKINKLLGMLKDVPFEKRTAKFVCAIAVVFPNGESFTVEGECKGVIKFEPSGENGFGYDPIFYVPSYEMTTAQMKSELKNEISHRGKALKLMLEKFQKGSIYYNLIL